MSERTDHRALAERYLSLYHDSPGTGATLHVEPYGLCHRDASGGVFIGVTLYLPPKALEFLLSLPESGR